jgi:hypothetical protein
MQEIPMAKVLSVIVGVSMLALAAAANAGGPIVLTDRQMDATTAGNSGTFGFSKNLSSVSNNIVTFSGRSEIYDVFQKEALIDVRSHVIGNSASLAFDNEAIGKNSNVQSSFSQQTVAGQGSSQSGLFVSAANGYGGLKYSPPRY